MSLLARILDAKRSELPELRKGRGALPTPPPPRDVPTVLGHPPPVGDSEKSLRFIAEIKFRSPSAGPLSRALSVEERAVAYAAAGASMLSILCDRFFFDGAWDHLRKAREALDGAGYTTPLLAKEFIVDPIQLVWARAMGADAALLIARILPDGALGELVQAARELSLEPLVEVVSEEERDAAEATGARVLGVNARDLDTLIMDPERARRVLSGIAKDRVALHLSGLKSPDEVVALRAGRAQGALIGEALMRQDDPRPLLASLVAAGRGPLSKTLG